MALLSVSMFDTVGAVSPHIVAPAIFKAPLQYLLVLALVALLWALRHVFSLALLILPLWWRLAAYLPVEFFTFYSLTITARILGLLYKSNSTRLGWFE